MMYIQEIYFNNEIHIYLEFISAFFFLLKKMSLKTFRHFLHDLGRSNFVFKTGGVEQMKQFKF